MVHQAKNTITTVIVLLASVVSLCACHEKQATMEEMKTYQGPVMEVDSLQTLFSDSSILRVKFNAGKELEYTSGDKEFLDGVRVEFFTTKGTQEAVLTAQKGYQEKLTSIYRVEGDVVVRNFKEKKELHTEKLFWDANKKKIYTPESEQVTIKTPTEHLIGKGMEANQDFSWYSLKNPVGTTTVKE